MYDYTELKLIFELSVKFIMKTGTLNISEENIHLLKKMKMSQTLLLIQLVVYSISNYRCFLCQSNFNRLLPLNSIRLKYDSPVSLLVPDHFPNGLTERCFYILNDPSEIHTWETYNLVEDANTNTR